MVGRVSKEIRKAIKFKKEKAPCYICGKHQAITEWHHAIPIKSILEDYTFHGENGFFQGDYAHTLYCLCPTCHAYIHKAYKHFSFTPEFVKILIESGYTDTERAKFIEIMAVYTGGLMGWK